MAVGRTSKHADSRLSRQRRSVQTGAGQVAVEKAALAKAAAVVKELAASAAASVEAMGRWSWAFEVRYGRPPTDDDLCSSAAIVEEARTLRSLLHRHAVADLTALSAEADLLSKQRSLAAAALRAWQRDWVATTENEPARGGW